MFPQYPNTLVNCPQTATSCALPASLAQFAQAGVSAFASNFKTPKVEQASFSLEREVANHLAVSVSYMYVHGVDLIRARDVNLPPPVNVEYPVYDSSGINFLGTFYDIPSFSTWQQTRSFTCPYPPCINPLARPIPQLGAIDQFESAASSVYNGATLSIHRQMSSGLDFRLSYTFAHAIDDGQDALVAGEPSLVQNSYVRMPSADPALPISGSGWRSPGSQIRVLFTDMISFPLCSMIGNSPECLPWAAAGRSLRPCQAILTRMVTARMTGCPE